MTESNESEEHSWNQRQAKKPIMMYLIIGLMCLLLGWLLSGMG